MLLRGSGMALHAEGEDVATREVRKQTPLFAKGNLPDKYGGWISHSLMPSLPAAKPAWRWLLEPRY